MTISFSLHENVNLVSEKTPLETSPASIKNLSHQKLGNFHLFSEKLTVPKFEDYFRRARLEEKLKKSLLQFSATLITGRAGTGKTALAVDFSRNYQHLAWLSVELTESDWAIFYRYFYESLRQMTDQLTLTGKNKLNGAENISSSLENVLTEVSFLVRKKSALIVIDGLHNIFDAEWFGEFFTTLLHSLSPQIHLLMLSRSNPPLPLWRLRAKQVLGVIDEKLLAFTMEEIEELFQQAGLPTENIKSVHTKTHGRISHLKNLMNRRNQ